MTTDPAAPPPWLWIALTIGAAVATALRNASQRHLAPQLGEIGATFIRFSYALPFATAWLLVVTWWTGSAWTTPSPVAIAWVLVGSFAQIAATALLLTVMRERNFALGVAYSHTQVLQVAVFALVVLGERISTPVAIAIVVGTVGVALLSPVDPYRPLQTLLKGLGTKQALKGLACGSLFAITSLSFRAAALSIPEVPYVLAGAQLLLGALLVQCIALGAWMLVHQAQTVRAVISLWRGSLLAGFTGALATAAWNTAYAIEPVAHVRMLGLVELLFSYAISRRFFREHITPVEIVGMLLVGLGITFVTAASM